MDSGFIITANRLGIHDHFTRDLTRPVQAGHPKAIEVCPGKSQ